jgi:hypothetical protein
MARITTLTIRIASICKPTNIRLSIAASIFVAAGILLIFVINLLWTQRIVRSLHPTFGWHRAFSYFLLTLYILIVLTLAIVITATVQSFYTLNTNTRRIDRDLQLYASTLLALISFLPLPILTIALLAPHQKAPHADPFGAGRFRTKIAVLLTGTTLVCFGACYRCGTSWMAPVPRSQPLPPYFSKEAFYMADFGVEVLTIYLYAVMRVDRRFHVPDGAKGAGSYGVGRDGVKGAEEYGMVGGDGELRGRNDSVSVAGSGEAVLSGYVEADGTERGVRRDVGEDRKEKEGEAV